MRYESAYEATVIEGLEAISLRELHDRLGSQFRMLHSSYKWPGVLQFQYVGNPRKLLQLKTILSVFTIQYFPGARPTVLLGHQNFQKLVRQVNAVRALMPKGGFRTFYLAAAGSDSSVMLRLKEEITSTTGLMASEEEGDLLLRLRHPRDQCDGWESLVRMSPRPLSVRKWRVCDYEGALNASIAYAMVQLTNPTPEDIIINPACGSGTLLVERLSSSPARLAIGCDINPDGIRCANKNINASRYKSSIQVYPWDAQFLPLMSNSVDVIVTDLPFGHDVGSHEENEILYPRLLNEVARVARQNARFVLITHELRMIRLLLENSTDWNVDHVLPITINGLHPKIYVLKKK